MLVLVDTGPLVASVNARDQDHARVASYLQESRDLFIVPVTVLPEVCYLLERFAGPRLEAEFLKSLLGGEMVIEQPTVADLGRSWQLILAYADNPFDFAQDRPIGFVDASIVAMAERLNITRILTLDRRHFSAIRPQHVPAFELVP